MKRTQSIYKEEEEEEEEKKLYLRSKTHGACRLTRRKRVGEEEEEVP